MTNLETRLSGDLSDLTDNEKKLVIEAAEKLETKKDKKK